MKTPSKKLAMQGFESRVYRQETIVGYFENRGETRIAHKSRVKIKELKSGVFINARMLHYSENGAYLEADTLLLPGAVVYLGIEDSPFIPGGNVYDVYRAEVVWLRLLKSMSYKYGYGIKFILAHPKSK